MPIQKKARGTRASNNTYIWRVLYVTTTSLCFNLFFENGFKAVAFVLAISQTTPEPFASKA